MKRYNKNLGDFGESVAEECFKQKGYKILERNYLVHGGEIDIIAMDNGVLVFAEVKTRSSNMYGAPAEAVDKKKMKHMLTAAEKYYRSNPIDAQIRFDVVEVIAKMCDGVPAVISINHIEDAVVE